MGRHRSFCKTSAINLQDCPSFLVAIDPPDDFDLLPSASTARQSLWQCSPVLSCPYGAPHRPTKHTNTRPRHKKKSCSGGWIAGNREGKLPCLFHCHRSQFTVHSLQPIRDFEDERRLAITRWLPPAITVPVPHTLLTSTLGLSFVSCQSPRSRSPHVTSNSIQSASHLCSEGDITSESVSAIKIEPHPGPICMQASEGDS